MGMWCEWLARGPQNRIMLVRFQSCPHKIIIMKKNIVFLDVDGVLNYTKWYISDRNPGNLYGKEGDLDPLCIKRINKICEECNAEIVLSSDWRVNSYSFTRLEKAGLINIIDKTPIPNINILGGKFHITRGEEIQMWLENHKDVDNYVIIDDRSDFLEEQLSHFVHIDPYIGITDDDCVLIKNILNRC